MTSIGRKAWRSGIRVCLASAAIGFGSATHAADLKPMPVKAVPPAPAYSPWQIDVTPYGWMPSLNGTSTIKGHEADIDASFFGDIIHRKIPEQLFGLMMAFEARNDRFALLGDFVYMKLGASGGAARSKTLGPVASVGIGVNFDASLNVIVTELSGAYELARWGSATTGTWTSWDVYAGGRLWWQQAEASVDGNAALLLVLPRQAFEINGSRAVAKSGDVTWVDPIVGMRLRHQFAPGQELTLSGDVGGFGVGSEFTWQAVGAYRFEIARTSTALWSGMLGYRALYADYSKGSGNTLYQYDMLMHGPIAGISARF
jgi:hypothetical protein